MKYLVMKEVKHKLSDTYRVVKRTDNLTSAMAHAIRRDIFGNGLVVKEIENFEIRER